jgi:hypothetical protein
VDRPPVAVGRDSSVRPLDAKSLSFGSAVLDWRPPHVRVREIVQGLRDLAEGGVMPSLLLLLLLIPLIGFWVWMVRDMMQNPYLTASQRTFWMVVLLFGNVFGAAIYYWYVYRSH